jgi:flavin-dependent dehydrogenase
MNDERAQASDNDFSKLDVCSLPVDCDFAREYDVIVVGASVAGASAALQLAKLGFTVLLLEKSRFPRLIACGEGLSQIGVEALSPLLDDAARKGLSLDSLPYCDFYSYNIRGRSTIVVGGNGQASVRARGVSRYYLDAFLCKAASMHPLIEVATGVRVAGISQSDSGVKVYLAGVVTPLESRFGVIATGKSYRMPSDCGFRQVEGARHRVGASAEFLMTDATPKDLLMTVFVKSGLEVYCTPVGQNRINLNVLTTGAGMADLGRKRGIEDLFKRTLDSYGVSALQHSEILGSLPSGARLKDSCRGNLVVVGDALESLDPVGGMGMTNAIISGRLAAYGIASSFKDGSPLSRNCARIRGALLPLRQVTQGAALVVRTFSRFRAFESLNRIGVLDFIEDRMLERHLAWARRL